MITFNCYRILVLLIVLFQHSIYAESSNFEQNNIVELEEFSVYADKLERPIDDLPHSVSIISKPQLKIDATSEVNSIINHFANTYTGVHFGSPFSIRGVGNDSVSPAPLEKANGLATVFISKVPLTVAKLHYFRPTLFDVDSIAVVRGPLSTSHGPNSLNGSLFMQYTEPTYNNEG